MVSEVSGPEAQPTASALLRMDSGVGEAVPVAARLAARALKDTAAAGVDARRAPAATPFDRGNIREAWDSPLGRDRPPTRPASCRYPLRYESTRPNHAGANNG